MKKVLKIAETILIDIIILILLILAIIVIYSLVQLNIANKEYANLFGYTIFEVETGSMSGTIEIDDIIIVKLDNNDIQKNDIITYRKDNSFVTHRIIKIDDNSIITKGDSNNTEDEPITKENVVGKVVYTLNNIKVWKAVFSDVKVIISISITFILFILIILYKEKTGVKND